MKMKGNKINQNYKEKKRTKLEGLYNLILGFTIKLQ